MATIVISAASLAIFAWAFVNPSRVEDVFFLGNASLYSEPWRVLTSTFIHRLAGHFGFNLLTLLWFGREVERRYGTRIMVVMCLGALWTGQMATLLAGMLPLHGISGGVCALYGFLLVLDRKQGLIQTLTQRPQYWLYPAALVLLSVFDWLGLIAVADLNHVVSIALGAAAGLALTAKRHRLEWRTSVALAAIAITIGGAYVSEREWRNLPSIAPFDCAIARRPIGDVTRNGFVRVNLLDRQRRLKSIYYINTAGTKVLVSTNSRATYRLFPFVGSIWRIEDSGGGCRVQFEAGSPGTVAF